MVKIMSVTGGELDSYGAHNLAIVAAVEWRRSGDHNVNDDTYRPHVGSLQRLGKGEAEKQKRKSLESKVKSQIQKLKSEKLKSKILKRESERKI